MNTPLQERMKEFQEVLDSYTVEESSQLLHYIFPNYPDLRFPKRIPDVKQFLKELRKR